MIGGLIADEYQQSEDRVPLLGDIPIVGNLFRNTSRTRKKTNLMVFLKPVVLRDGSSTLQLSQDRYDAIRGVQQVTQPVPNLLMRSVDAAAVLPPAPGPGMPLATEVLNVPGSTPQLVDFTRPEHPTVNGQPIKPAPHLAPGTIPGGL